MTKRGEMLRINMLNNKYIIACDSQYGDDILYLQDKNCGSGYWTRYLVNAIGFTNIEDARYRIRNLKYNNPRIYKFNNYVLQSIERCYDGK